MKTGFKFWMSGIAVILLGLLLARWISEVYASQPVLHLAVYLTGVVIAMAGLGIILIGIRKK
jgi:hypothetical protein